MAQLVILVVNGNNLWHLLLTYDFYQAVLINKVVCDLYLRRLDVFLLLAVDIMLFDIFENLKEMHEQCRSSRRSTITNVSRADNMLLIS